MQQRPPRPRSGSVHAQSAIQSLELRQLLASAAPPYLVPTAPGVEIAPLITVGEAAPNGYEMIGIPDGLGAYDNGDGTFTVLMNHELRPDRGGIHAHGSKGAFVSKWIIRKDTLEIVSGSDLIQSVKLWNPVTDSFDTFDASNPMPVPGGVPALSGFNRFCSADLPDATAFFDPKTGLGTLNRIYMNGEETSNGRAFAHLVTGPGAGVSWELPWMGKFAFENNVASPFPQKKTIVAGLDDSRREFSAESTSTALVTEPSEVYFWVGDKRRVGNDIERAGLVNGILHGMRVGTPRARGQSGTFGTFVANEASISGGERFELVRLKDHTDDLTFQSLQEESIAKGITQFRRVEDGHWDTTNPDVFRFVTTDQFGGNTRLWKLTFDDITKPEKGGRIEIEIDSPANVPGEMFDNITVNHAGDVLLQEDPGNQPYLAKVWEYDTSTGDLVRIAQHNPDLFLDTDPATPGVQSVLDIDPVAPGNNGTQDEESSGIIDLSHILGPGFYLADVQAHYALPDPYVEAGQFLVINTNAATASVSAPAILQGGLGDDDLRAGAPRNAANIWSGRPSFSSRANALGTIFADKLIDDLFAHRGED
jgi:hypothetical protein